MDWESVANSLPQTKFLQDESTCNILFISWWLRQWRICLPCRRPGFDPWVGKIPWRRAWLSIPGFWPGEFHGRRSLAGYSPWSHKQANTAEWLSLRLTPQYWASLVTQQWSSCLPCRRLESDPWVRKTPWRKAWQHTPAFLPGERSLADYSPRGLKESDVTKAPQHLWDLWVTHSQQVPVE